MTDEQMDARLRAAGEQWRSANESPAGIDVAATVAAHEPLDVSPAPRRPRHWGLLASAAVIAAALAVGGTFALRGGNDTPSRPNADDAGLVGTVWELVGYNDGPDLRTSSNATFYIDRDGQLVADDSCAVIGAKAHAGAGELTVTDQVVRYRSCTDTVGEMVFTNGGTKVLDGTARYEVDGDTMTISRDGTTMHFVAAPNDPAPSLDVPTFVGAHWTLVKAVDADGNDVLVEGEVPFFVADDGSLTAGDGCNTLTGKASGLGRVTFADVGGTDIGCPRLQLTIQAMLNGTVDESVDGATLTLQKDGAGKLVYQWVPADTAGTDPQALDGKTWRLRSSVGEPAVSDAQLTIDGTTYTANDGCRTFSGDVSVEPGTVAFTGVPKDNPPCGGAGAGQASTFDSFLSTGGLWAIRDGELVIWDAATGQQFALVFLTGSTPPPTVTNPGDALIGVNWYLSQISTDDGSTSSGHSVDAQLLLRMARDGSVLLSERCAQGEGSVTINDGTADFAGLELTDHSCPAPTPDSPGDLGPADAATVLQVLDGKSTWSLDGGQLSITKGGSTLTFGPTPPTTTAPTDPGAELIGRTWYLTVVEPDVRGTGPVYNVTTEVTLTFDRAGGARLADACVDTDWDAHFDAQTVDFSNSQGETHSCPSGPRLTSSNRAVVMRVLDGVVTWSLDGQQLTITNGNDALVFRDAPPVPASLLGTHWVLTGFEYNQSGSSSGGGSGGSAGTPTGPTLDIGSDGAFTTDSTCAPVRGNLKVADATVRFSQVAPIDAHCIDGGTDQNSACDLVFQDGPASVDLTDGELTLSRNGAVLHFGPE